MAKLLYVMRYFDKNTISGLKLFCLWFAGLFLGLFAAGSSGDSLVSLLSITPFVRPLFFNAILASMLPLLISVFTVLFFSSAAVFLLCFLRACLMGFLLGGTCICFSGISLLMVLLMLFPALLSSAIVLVYWQRMIRDPITDFARDTAIAAFGCFAAGAADYFIFSPFLADVVLF